LEKYQPFEKYSVFYDLLYRDKDYAAEAEYVARAIRSANPSARSILELGSGTGRHGQLLAAMVFDIHGIERSPEMVSTAKTRVDPTSAQSSGSFTCEVGDICTAKLGRTFDAVIALFHVISYQATNHAMRAAFQVASDHLRPGGVFLFDVWHAPTVLSQGPSERVKEVADGRHRVRRIASPDLDSDSGGVNVVYRMDCKDRTSGETVRFSEEHLMRYLSPTEVDLLAQICGLRLTLKRGILDWAATVAIHMGRDAGPAEAASWQHRNIEPLTDSSAHLPIPACPFISALQGAKDSLAADFRHPIVTPKPGPQGGAHKQWATFRPTDIRFKSVAVLRLIPRTRVPPTPALHDYRDSR
jgi:SAM-dependent methyltransferase